MRRTGATICCQALSLWCFVLQQNRRMIFLSGEEGTILDIEYIKEQDLKQKSPVGKD